MSRKRGRNKAFANEVQGYHRALTDGEMMAIADKIIAGEALSEAEELLKKLRPRILGRILTVKEGRARQSILDALNGAEPTKVMGAKTRNRLEQPITTEEERIAFYKSRAWRELRYRAIVEHGGKCQACGRGATNGIVIHVDHVKPISRYPGLKLEIANLQVLCEDCNLGKGAWDDTDWRVPRLVYDRGEVA